ncbi:MAG: tol-pal system protein YbgF [Alphaproteobacteria bacterium]|nr:tol-pal system protein YbgF [Alphaproteobacteria bacterium]
MNSRVLGNLVVLAAISVVPAQAALTTDPAQSGYDAAVGLTRARSYEQAEFAWLNFLRQYPNSPLDGNAQYFLGETYYGRNDYRHAAAAYAAGIEKYPKGDMAAETLLKLGISLGRSGDQASACEAFARLDRDFSAAAGVVRERSLVEKRQYHCTDSPSQAGATVGDGAARASVIPATVPGPDAAAPAPAAPAPSPEAAPAKIASLEPRGSDGEPAPPAVPTIPVERKKLSEIDAERAAARAELVVPPPPVSGKSAHRPIVTASAASTASTDTIKTAQNLLTALNYDVGPADGQAGPKLREAISAFETKSGMHSDGEVSDQLLQHLSAALAVHKKPAPEAPQSHVVGAGTGFVVSKSGFVMTSYHLVEQCGEVRVRSPGSDGAVTPLIASDTHDDLALLRLPSPAAAAVTFREGRGPHQGDGIVVAGLSPNATENSEFYLTSGTISALSGAKNDNGVLKLSVPVGSERGSAPVFDRTGEVVGILSGGVPAKGAANKSESDIALRATIARNFLDVHDVDYESGQSSTELKASEIGEQAKGAVVLVECWH